MAALVEERLAVLELAAEGEVAGVVDGVVLRISGCSSVLLWTVPRLLLTSRPANHQPLGGSLRGTREPETVTERKMRAKRVVKVSLNMASNVQQYKCLCIKCCEGVLQGLRETLSLSERLFEEKVVFEKKMHYGK